MARAGKIDIAFHVLALTKDAEYDPDGAEQRQLHQECVRMLQILQNDGVPTSQLQALPGKRGLSKDFGQLWADLMFWASNQGQDTFEHAARPLSCEPKLKPG